MSDLIAPTGPMARPEDPQTSHDAPPSLDRLSELQQLILGVHECTPEGLTNDQLAGILPHVKPGTLVKRVTELHRDGWLVNSGETRRVSDSQRDAIVWKVAQQFFCEGCGRWFPGVLLDAEFFCATCNEAGNWTADYGDCPLCSHPCDRGDGVCSRCANQHTDSHFSTALRHNGFTVNAADHGVARRPAPLQLDLERGVE